MICTTCTERDEKTTNAIATCDSCGEPTCEAHLSSATQRCEECQEGAAVVAEAAAISRRTNWLRVHSGDAPRPTLMGRGI